MYGDFFFRKSINWKREGNLNEYKQWCKVTASI